MSTQDQAADEVVASARRAAAEGRSVFVAAIAVGAPYQSSRALPACGDLVAAIEAEGWRLEQWTVGQDALVGVQLYPLFRRVD
jgi:hypothetical protein